MIALLTSSRLRKVLDYNLNTGIFTCLVQRGPRNAGERTGWTGLKGVVPSLNKWQAQIADNGRSKYLGTFETPEAAHAAYVEAAKKAYGDFATDGEPHITPRRYA